jgi:uncharacterized protein (TIGR00255 family)
LIKSMTAFGRDEYVLGDRVYTAEIRTLNNRYRDFNLRLPKVLQAIEDEIRNQIGARVRRGRIEVTIQIEKNGKAEEYHLDLNGPLIKTYLGILKQLGDEFGLDPTIRAEELCRMKDVIIIKPEEVEIDEIRPGVHELLTRALDGLDLMRSEEGRAIEKDFVTRLSLIEVHLAEIEDRTPIVVEEYRRRLRDKIKALAEGIEVDENRVLQEVAILADRCDITEELVRFRSHLNQFRQYMSLDDAVGRRLDFLLQEMNREVNTINAKASDAAVSARAVEIKAELEKIREQVQNVE